MKTFEHTQTTTAPAHAVWQRWAAVSDWPTQNPLVESAELVGDFAVGSTIKLKPKKGPKNTLKITTADLDRLFIATGSIPLGHMRIEHHLSSVDGVTTFTHRIVIDGPFSGLFAKMVGKNMAAELPDMMQKIAIQAEAASE